MTGSPQTLGEAERTALSRCLSVASTSSSISADDLPWRALLSYIGLSLAPLILDGIDQRRLLAVPVDVLAALHDRRQRLAALYLRRQRGLGAACAALDRAGIPSLVLKGAALAHLVYRDPVLRPMTDIDIWVPPAQLDDAVRAIEPVGFRLRSDTARQIGLPSIDAHPERQLEAIDTPVHVELHGRLRSLAGVPWASFEDAWRASDEAALGGVRTRVLNPEHQLAHTGLHLARTNVFAGGVHHLVDIALIIRRWQDHWSWPQLVADWRRWRASTWLILAVTMARDLLDAPAPPDLESVHAGLDWVTMRRAAEERLWEAARHRLPPAIGGALRARARADTLRWLRRRIIDYYWQSQRPRPLHTIVTEGAGRLFHDLCIKVPRYVLGWARGDLRGRRLADGLALEQARAELEGLVAASGDIALAPDQGAHPAPPAGPTIAWDPAGR